MNSDQTNPAPANTQSNAYNKLSETIDGKILDFNFKILALLASLIIKPLALATEPFFRRNFGERYFTGTGFFISIVLWNLVQKASDGVHSLAGSPLEQMLLNAHLNYVVDWMQVHNIPGRVAWVVSFAYGFLAWQNYARIKTRRQTGRQWYSMSRGESIFGSENKIRDILIRPAELGAHPTEFRATFGKKPERKEPQPFLTPASECVVVVSGLPRSGTSMMMQMIWAGGFPILADEERLADESNPKGYLEYGPAKRILNNHSWLAGATGSAVKLVSPLLPHLPRNLGIKYRIILMIRPVPEVVVSQRTMLARDGKGGSPIADAALAEIFERQILTTRTLLTHLQLHGDAEVMEVSYHGALEDPAAVASRLKAFLGDGFDPAAAALVVEPSLHRAKR